MKSFKIIIPALILFLGLSHTSCVYRYRTTTVYNNGNHKGWYKNTNNPHHPNSTNPGKGHKKKR